MYSLLLLGVTSFVALVNGQGQDCSVYRPPILPPNFDATDGNCFTDTNYDVDHGSGCLFGLQGVDVGTYCEVDSIETPFRISIGGNTNVNQGDVPFVWAGDVSVDWQGDVDNQMGDIFVDTPTQDVWWPGKESQRPGVPLQCNRTQRTIGNFAVTPGSEDVVLDWLNPEGVIGSTGKQFNVLFVDNQRLLRIDEPGTYHFSSVYIGDGAIIYYSGPAGGVIEILADEDIVIEHNVQFINFGPRFTTTGAFLSLLYANNQVTGVPLRGVELWNSPRESTKTLHIGDIISQGDIHIGYRHNIRGCAAAAGYLVLFNHITYANDC